MFFEYFLKYIRSCLRLTYKIANSRYDNPFYSTIFPKTNNSAKFVNVSRETLRIRIIRKAISWVYQLTTHFLIYPSFLSDFIYYSAEMRKSCDFSLINSMPFVNLILLSFKFKYFMFFGSSFASFKAEILKYLFILICFHLTDPSF